MWMIFLITLFLGNCVNLNSLNSMKPSGADKLLDLLVLEQNLFLLDRLATRRISGQIFDMTDTPMSETVVTLKRINKKNIIEKIIITNTEGYFSMDLKIGIADLIINKNDIITGMITLNIGNDNVSYSSDKFKIKNLKSIYIYPSGYESPILFTGYKLSEKYYDYYYLDIEIANVSKSEMNFNDSNIICKTKGVKINYPYFKNNVNENTISKMFPGSRLLPSENRSMKYYMKNFWKYSEKDFDSEKDVRYYSSYIKYNLQLDRTTSKTQYFELEIDDDLKIGSQIEFELIINELNGKTHILPFIVIF